MTVDFAARSVELLNFVDKSAPDITPSSAQIVVNAAGVHATLALVEQQRITNMQVERDRLYVKAGRHVGDEAARIFAEAEGLDARIWKGLGL